jgi:hypothetical protein
VNIGLMSSGSSRHPEGRQESRDPPQVGAQPFDDQQVLQVTANHIELAHRPIDHLDDAVDEGDSERHERIEHADHNARDQSLNKQLGGEHGFTSPRLRGEGLSRT